MLKQDYFPLDFFYPQPCYYFILPFQTQEVLPCKINQNKEKEENINRSKDFMELFQKELRFRHQNSYVKEWSREQELLLLQMGKKCTNWNELSKKFDGKSAKVCHRKYNKLIMKQTKWPKQDEDFIKQLREVEKKTWIQIEATIKKYNAKKIRERYKNYLEVEVNRKRWELSQDLQLWNKVQELGKSWKQISVEIPQRSGLQLRNRYYKFLEPISKKLIGKTSVVF